MGHTPHVYLPPPWPGDVVPVPDAVRHHLEQVLRTSHGAVVSYTDGMGLVGSGVYRSGRIERGEEDAVAPPPAVRLAVAAPHVAQRTRFLVEKCAELGVAEIRWLVTQHSTGRIPKQGKAEAWAVGALQQSRGAHLMTVAGPSTWAELAPTRALIVAEPGGLPVRQLVLEPPVTIAIGPEAGFAADEAPDAPRLGLGPRILRTETAAIAAATLVAATLTAR